MARLALRIVLVAAVLLALVVAVATVRAFTLRSGQLEVAPIAAVALDEAAVAARLSAAIRLPTLSDGDAGGDDPAPFLALHALLEESFPAVHEVLEREIVGDLSLLFTWRGSDPTLPPILLLAHQDVVPVTPGTEADWTHPPFSGAIADGYVWGRGAIDDKGSLMAILEAVEGLLAEGYRPARTVYLAFGHDEEVGGLDGARRIANALEARGVRLAWVLDEGMPIGHGLLPGVAAPTALVGLSEKGYASFALVVETEGGHSSMPPPRTAAGILAEAVLRIESRQPKARLEGVPRQMLETLAPEMEMPMRLVAGNLWLTRPIVEGQMAGSPRTNAAIRTTVATTMLEGSPKENVLAARARAVVNLRLLPGDTVETAERRLVRAIDDPRVTVTRLGGLTGDPSPISAVDGPGYAAIARTVREVFPEAVVAPSLMIGATDGRHFVGVAQDVYRFFPFRLHPEDLPRIHGTDERMSLENYAEAIRFYRRLIENAQP
jgi:carboxypeptidase PM20D1